MTKQVEAVYENGVLRPLEPLPLDEHQRVTVTVSATEDPLSSIIDYAFVDECEKKFRPWTIFQVTAVRSLKGCGRVSV